MSGRAGFALLLLLAAAQAVHADEPAAGARAPVRRVDENLITVTKVVTGKCSTDGGGTKCAPGVKFLGEVLAARLNEWLQSARVAPISSASTRMACDSTGTVTIRLGYSYNDGTFVVLDGDKVQARWQPCMARFIDAAKLKLKDWYDLVHVLDPTMDMNSEYKITLKIVKTEGAGLDL